MGEITIEAVQVRAAAPVADVPVRADEELCGALDAQAGEGLSVDVVQHSGRGLAGEAMDPDKAGVAVLERGYVVAVPIGGGPQRRR